MTSATSLIQQITRTVDQRGRVIANAYAQGSYAASFGTMARPVP